MTERITATSATEESGSLTKIQVSPIPNDAIQVNAIPVGTVPHLIGWPDYPPRLTEGERAALGDINKPLLATAVVAAEILTIDLTDEQKDHISSLITGGVILPALLGAEDEGQAKDQSKGEMPRLPNKLAVRSVSENPHQRVSLRQLEVKGGSIFVMNENR